VGLGLSHPRARVRDLGLVIGRFPTGHHNAITDVDGVKVGHTTLIYDQPRTARTGVTVILPREEIGRDHCFAGFHSFNGNGEMTGVHWINESGLLSTPIAITATHYVGVAHRALVEYSTGHGFAHTFSLPVVAETYDGFLNDCEYFHLTPEHVIAALNSASAGPVAEGNVGGGTGMICHEFKGGIGTSSRVVTLKSGTFTVGVLVQANHGDRNQFRANGVPAGLLIPHSDAPLPEWDDDLNPPPQLATAGSSIIIVVATDAPMLPTQCRRLAQRATVGMARAGGVGHNGSGDLFLAFSTANHLVNRPEAIQSASYLPNHHLNDMFDAVADATEEAILNALCAAETMTGFLGRTVHALPLEMLRRIVAQRT